MNGYFQPSESGEPAARSARPSTRWIAGFLVLEALSVCLLFLPALTGRTILAPLDIFPAFFAHFRFLAGGSAPLPANHYLIDQAVYDLPLQYALYGAVGQRQLPWWDPLTYGGRPFLMDAHVNGTDPIRLVLYVLAPFLLAYNGTLILHLCLAGLGMFVLLGASFELPFLVAAGLAFAFQFASYEALHFGHPWLLATFGYYPFLWWSLQRRDAPLLVPSLLVAAVLYCGNVQSHAYLAVFFASLAAGRLLAGASWRAGVLPLVLPAAGGALLALPVLVSQIEFVLFENIRAVGSVSASPLRFLAGILTLGAVHPWAFGTFRSIDFTKVTSYNELAFLFYVGPAALVLAVLALCSRGLRRSETVCTAAVLLAVNVFIFTIPPLMDVLYRRSAGLGALGIIVLAAAGFRELDRPEGAHRPLGRLVLLLGAAVFAGVEVFASLVFPRVGDEIARRVAQASSGGIFSGLDEGLRAAQVAALPSEMSVRNPEAAASLLLLCLAGGALWRLEPGLRRRSFQVLLVASLYPLLHFFFRFIVSVPAEQWDRLRVAMESAGDAIPPDVRTGFRLVERRGAHGRFDEVFPYALAHLAGVPNLSGYSALQPRSLIETVPPDQREQFLEHRGFAARTVTIPELGGAPGPEPELTFYPRFIWRGPAGCSIRVSAPRFGEQDLELDGCRDGEVVSFDTMYPGWEASDDSGRALSIRRLEPPLWSLPIPGEVRRIRLAFRHRGRPVTASIAGAALAGLTLLALRRRPRARAERG